MEILLLLIIFGLGIGFGWNLREKAAERTITKMLEKLEEQQEEDEDKDRIAVTIENVNNQLMVYDMYSKQFMAQGADWECIEENLKIRYPGKKFHATKENLDDIGIKL